jgi:hypothetical protein
MHVCGNKLGDHPLRTEGIIFCILKHIEQMGILGQIVEDFDVEKNHYKDFDAKNLQK